MKFCIAQDCNDFISCDIVSRRIKARGILHRHHWCSYILWCKQKGSPRCKDGQARRKFRIFFWIFYLPFIFHNCMMTSFVPSTSNYHKKPQASSQSRRAAKIILSSAAWIVIKRLTGTVSWANSIDIWLSWIIERLVSYGFDGGNKPIFFLNDTREAFPVLLNRGQTKLFVCLI